ncbi:MAG: hypothetical protein A2900_00760 [Candidatus Chisholmbacteria bacterium RIFCSPLOWO2_01_FULL_50_28]|uniref:Double zinc ribbon domain-containing protein n=1 Tax=Candidatus Chisholmbacteria bacterium RIFCSPHIGHO2_01_FULL_52_32 TaxID=1797591 RepID=A0A1G1VUD6_9BACT|nr:MAG: hypothetical protein A2786_05820 [Candidatus Chisholmbacteria bacterium RIFCSPHIGHO2_01_FULL_52_32]OGY19620.1 MAG: hypothetical protein A2900_00760 [Candidatus Chisholmbacteria bacterium RIFCSPLOWO2_01_FULL_50_28]
MSLLDLVFPKTCVRCGRIGEYFCPECIGLLPPAAAICPLCQEGSIGGVTHARCQRTFGLDGLVSIYSYNDGIREAVKRLKYRFVRGMAKAFVEAVMERIDPLMVSFFRRKRFVVCPVPLSSSRERWRGFNQAALLGEILAQHMDLPLVRVLKRVKDTGALADLKVRMTAGERQMFVKRYRSTTQQAMAERRFLAEKKVAMRRGQMKGAFEISEKLKVKSAKFLLVDDVWTSGATIAECTKVLKRHGASAVWGFTFARSGRAF